MTDDRPSEDTPSQAPWEAQPPPSEPPRPGGAAPLGVPDAGRADMPTGPLPPASENPGAGAAGAAGPGTTRAPVPGTPGGPPPPWTPPGGPPNTPLPADPGPSGPPRELWLALAGVLAVIAVVMLLLVNRGRGATPPTVATTSQPPAVETALATSAAAAETALAALPTATLPPTAAPLPTVPTPAPTLVPPVAAITAPETGQVGQPLRFSGSGSTSGSPIVGYLWDFGDGSRSLGSDVDHGFDQAGSYPVLLTITDAAGRQAIARHAILIEPSPQRPPSAVIAGPATGKVGQSLTFDAAASQPGSAPITRYSWRFGDGGTSQGQVVTHAFQQPGVFQVTVDVVDANNLWSSASLQVTIASPTPPKAVIKAPSAARVGETLTFNGSDSTSGSPIVTYLWKFGDGGATDAVVAAYAYDAADSYNVTLTVVDATGARNTATHALRIEAQPASGPQAVISGSAQAVAGQPTSFSGKSSTAGGSPISRYDWIVGGPGGRGSGSGVTFDYTFPAPGVYVVTLIVADRAGLADAASLEVTVAR